MQQAGGFVGVRKRGSGHIRGRGQTNAALERTHRVGGRRKIFRASNHQRLQLLAKCSFDRRGVGRVGLQHVAEHAHQPGVALAIGQHALHGFVQTFAKLRHLVQQAQTAVQAAAIFAQRGEALQRLGLLVAKRRHLLAVRGDVAMDALKRVLGHQTLRLCGQPRAQDLVKLQAQALAANIGATQFRFQRRPALLHGGQATECARTLTLDARHGLRAATHGVFGGFHLLGEVVAFAREGGHLAVHARHRLLRLRRLVHRILETRCMLLTLHAQGIETRGLALHGGAILGACTLHEFKALFGLALHACGFESGLFQLMPTIQRGGALGIRLVARGFGGLECRSHFATTIFKRRHLAGEAIQALAQLVILLECQRGAQRASLRLQRLELARLLGLSAHDAKPSLHAAQLLAHRHQMALGMVELARGLMLASAEACHAGCLLDDGSALDGLRTQHRIHLALFDDAVGIVADARVQEQLAHVAQAHLAVVHQILAATICPQTAFHLHLVGIHRQQTILHQVATHGTVAGGFLAIQALERLGRLDLGGNLRHIAIDRVGQSRIVELQDDARVSARLARGAAGEDDIQHGAAAQALRAALAEHPLDGVHHVALAAAVGAHDAGDGGVKTELRRIGEALETGKHQTAESHRTSCRSSARPSWTGSGRNGLHIQRGTVSAAFGFPSRPAPPASSEFSRPGERLFGDTALVSGGNSGRSSTFSSFSLRRISARMRSCSARKSAFRSPVRESSCSTLRVSP